jgi:hypothetical protein
MASTSPIASALAVEGLLLQIGNGSSPETMQTIANATDFSLPVMSDVVDVTNVGDAWHRRFPTLHDMGKISFKVFWIPEEVTHRNAANGGTVGAGLRYLMINSLKRDFQFVYPDGNSSTDAFPGYVTSFSITGKVGGVFEASVEISNDGAPSLV